MLARLKFDISELVNHILDAMPRDAIINGTVLDPAIGGGQFVREVERRKREAGKSDQEIRDSVVGFEENSLRKDYAVNKYELKGTYQTKFLEKDFKQMKFDVIVGNPPYQDGSQEGGQNKIYNQITKKSLSLLKDDGKIGFITPTSVLKYSKRFSLVGQEGLKVVDFTADDHFDVGIDICSWIVDKTHTGDVTVIHADGTNTQSKDQVVYDYSKVDPNFAKLYQVLKEVTNEPTKRMFAQNNFGPALNKEKTETHTYRLYKLENNELKGTYWSSRVPYFENKKKFTVCMTKSLENAVYVGYEDFDMAYMTTEVDNDDEINNIKSFISTDYFRSHCEQWKGVDGYGYNYALKYLPPFDKTKSWTETEVKTFLEGFLDGTN